MNAEPVADEVRPAADPPDRQPDHEPVERPMLGRQLSERMRWLVAAVEVAAAIALVVLAVWAWDRSAIAMRLPESENPAIPDFSSRTAGPWVATAVATMIMAGALILDAVREIVLAARARRGTGGTRGAHGTGRAQSAHGSHSSAGTRTTHGTGGTRSSGGSQSTHSTGGTRGAPAAVGPAEPIEDVGSPS